MRCLAAALAIVLLCGPVAPAFADPTDDPFMEAPIAAPAPPKPRLEPKPESEPLVAVTPPTPTVPDGAWIVAGSPNFGNADCGRWVVRIKASQGQLSGSVTVGGGTRELQPSPFGIDGSFTTSTAAGTGTWGGRPDAGIPIYTVVGKISGETATVTLTVSGSKCNLERTAQGRRVAEPATAAAPVGAGLAAPAPATTTPSSYVPDATSESAGIGVPSGVVAQIAQAVSHNSRCEARLPPITIIEQPQHGTVTIREETVRVPEKQLHGGSACVGDELPGRRIYYQSQPGFHGVDRVVYDVVIGNSTLHKTVDIMVQ